MPTPLEKAREYLDPLEAERGGPRAERTKTASRLMRCTAPVSDAADLRRPENTSVTRRTRPIAIICQPWDHVASESNNSIVTVSYQLARCLARERHVTIYGRRKSGQESREIDSENIEFRHLKIRHRPQAIIERLLSIVACYKRRRINYMLSAWYHLFYAVRVALSIRTSKCDVVLVHNFLQFASVIKLFNPSATICLQMHCEWLRQFATAASERRLRKVDLIIGVSGYITECNSMRFPAIAERCHTVCNGVDTDRFCPSPGVPAQSDGTQHVLCVARLSPEKGVHVLIRAFKLLRASHPSLRLDIVGGAYTQAYLYLAPDPDDPAMATLVPFYGKRLSEMVRRQLVLKGQAYLNDLVAESAGDDRIVFHGVIRHSETIAFYRQASVMVLPSVWNEPSGLPAFEAAACGLPVVATRSGGISEIVEHGRTGILVTRGDAEALAQAIGQVIDDPALARAMGEAGRQRMLERFTWEASSRRLADLIEGVSGPGRQSNILKRAAPERSGSQVGVT
jgi:glycosyltransferase involved in cell wall biosynthesis